MLQVNTVGKTHPSSSREVLGRGWRVLLAQSSLGPVPLDFPAPQGGCSDCIFQLSNPDCPPQPRPTKAPGPLPMGVVVPTGLCWDLSRFTGRAEGMEGALGSDKHLFANKQAGKVGSASPPSWCYRCPCRYFEVLPRSLGNREVNPWVTRQRLWHSTFCLGLPWVQFRRRAKSRGGQAWTCGPWGGQKGK